MIVIEGVIFSDKVDERWAGVVKESGSGEGEKVRGRVVLNKGGRTMIFSKFGLKK